MRIVPSPLSPKRRRRPFCWKEAAGDREGSGEPNKNQGGHHQARSKVREIAEMKMPDLNANDVEAAMRIVEGTARSMGIEIED